MHHGGPSLYLKVAETIKGRILNHTYPPGDRIPAAKDLALEFNVSNITIRKAVEWLHREGYLDPRQGTGTLVTLPELKKVEIQISGDFRTWLDSASGRSPRLEVELLDVVTLMAPQRVRALLGVDATTPVGRIRRLRRSKGQIVSYFINYLHADHLKQLPRNKLSSESFIEAFQESTRIRLKRLDQRVESTIAEMDLAEILETDYGAPLFFVENIYYSNHEHPVEVTHMYYRGDRYVYRAAIPLTDDDNP